MLFQVDAADWALSVAVFRRLMSCPRCGSLEGVKWRPSMTAYADDPGVVLYCAVCYDEYTEYWQAMWEEHNRSRG